MTVSNLGSYQEEDELQQREEAEKRMMKKKMSEQVRQKNTLWAGLGYVFPGTLLASI